MTAILAQPLALPCGTTLSNRLAKSATQEGLSDSFSHASESLCTLYRRWSEGGAGLLVTGDVMVDYTHRERPGNVVVDGNGGFVELRKWSAAGRSAGNHLWMQINQPGRQTPASILSNPMAPSATAEGLPPLGFGSPREITEAEILDLIKRFAHVATVARETGFTGVQLHSAHGFMSSSFLSPLANRRQDQWGGSLENRARFLIESLRAIRRAVGKDFPVSVKINSADFQKGGFSMEDSIRVVEMLNHESLDLLEISGGNYSAPAMIGKIGGDHPLARKKAQSTLRREAYFTEYAKKVRPLAKMPLMMTGGFRTLGVMEEAVSSGDTDVIGLARPFCAGTDFCGRLLKGEISEVPMVEEELLLDRALYESTLDDRAFNLVESDHQLSWMYLQLVRLGKGLDIDWAMSLETAPQKFAESEDEREQARCHALGSVDLKLAGSLS